MRHTREPKSKFTATLPKDLSLHSENNVGVDTTLPSLSNLIKTNESDQMEFMKSLPFLLMGCARNGVLEHMTDNEIKDLRINERYGL
ncbi:MAG: hypothetical protein ABIN80_01995 [Dyadobacter sp.]|uniref:hypothetical protein n=1 Tax=Dyadobacter sp. TaxID=1914288 RepID=UPI003266990A